MKTLSLQLTARPGFAVFGELFDFFPITLAELARRSKLNEVTLAHIRDGKRTRSDTVNKLMMTLLEIYEDRRSRPGKISRS